MPLVFLLNIYLWSTWPGHQLQYKHNTSISYPTRGFIREEVKQKNKKPRQYTIKFKKGRISGFNLGNDMLLAELRLEKAPGVPLRMSK